MKRIIRLIDLFQRKDWRLLAIFLLGFCLRCINLTSRSIQYDDAFSYFLARGGWHNIISGTAADTMPPLYYFLLHIWMLISQEIGWLRLLSILMNLVGIYFLYLLVKYLAGQDAGLWAAFFATISPLQIYHAQDIRMYSLLAAAELGYSFFFLRIWMNGHKKLVDWIGLVLCGSIAMYTHNLAVFVLVVPDIFLMIKRSWKKLSLLVGAQTLVGVLYLPWMVQLPGQIEKIQRAFWTPQPGLVEIFQSIIIMTTNLPLNGIWFIIGSVISLELLVIIGWLGLQNRTKNHHLLLLVILFLIPPAILFILSYLMRPVFVPRGFLASTLAYLGLAAVVTVQTQKKWIRGLIAGGFIAASLIGLPYQLEFSQFPRSPYRLAMQAIENEISPGEIVVHDNKLSFFPSHYYAPELPQSFIRDEAGSPNDTYAESSQKAIGLIPAPTLESAVADASGIYFVVFQKTIDEYQAAGYTIHPSLVWLENNYRLVDQKTFNDLWIFFYKQ